MTYQLRFTDRDLTGTLYACCAALRDATERACGAVVVRDDGKPVAFFDEYRGRVVRTVEAYVTERNTISALAQ